jgi:hypothetical protein
MKCAKPKNFKRNTVFDSMKHYGVAASTIAEIASFIDNDKDDQEAITRASSKSSGDARVMHEVSYLLGW